MFRFFFLIKNRVISRLLSVSWFSFYWFTTTCGLSCSTERTTTWFYLTVKWKIKIKLSHFRSKLKMYIFLIGFLMLNRLSTFSGSGAWSMVTDISRSLEGFWRIEYKERVFLVFAFPEIRAQRTGLIIDPRYGEKETD